MVGEISHMNYTVPWVRFIIIFSRVDFGLPLALLIELKIMQATLVIGPNVTFFVDVLGFD